MPVTRAADCCASEAPRERESSYYWMGIHAFVQRWKKNLSNDRDHTGKHLCLQQCCIDILWENFESISSMKRNSHYLLTAADIYQLT